MRAEGPRERRVPRERNEERDDRDRVEFAESARQEPHGRRAVRPREPADREAEQGEARVARERGAQRRRQPDRRARARRSERDPRRQRAAGQDAAAARPRRTRRERVRFLIEVVVREVHHQVKRRDEELTPEIRAPIQRIAVVARDRRAEPETREAAEQKRRPCEPNERADPPHATNARWSASTGAIRPNRRDR